MKDNPFSSFQKSLNIADFGLAWIIFFSIVFQRLAPIGFLLIFISLFVHLKKNTFEEFKNYFFKGPAIWFIFYYLLLLLGMLWSENHSFGIQKLENKLTFILFPILYFFSVHKWGKLEWKELIIWSLFFILVIYELLAFWRFFTLPNQPMGYQFMESRFSLFMHRSYFACYLSIGIVFLMIDLKKQYSIGRILLAIFFIVGVLQTGSKAGILSLFPILIVYVLSSIKFLTQKSVWIFGSFMLFLFLVISFTNNPIKQRFKNSWIALNEIKLKNNPTIESNAARLIMWNTSLEVWQENFILGTGTGDYDHVLTKRNIENNNDGVAKERLNSHNQFLNTGVQLGLIGFIILIFIFIASWFNVSKNRYLLLILIVFLIHFLVESFLETQSGIVLFCILLMVFFNCKVNYQSESETKIL